MSAQNRESQSEIGKRSKLLEGAMALLQATPSKLLNIVVLNKALFYLDLYALRDLGKLVTEQKYFALPQGPVVGKYDKKLVSGLQRAGWAEQLHKGKAKPISIIREIQFTLLSDSELALATQVAAFAHKFSSSQISDYSHENPAWRTSFSKYSPGRPATQIDMQLALQQVLDEDPWLSEPLDPKTKAIATHIQHSALLDW